MKKKKKTGHDDSADLRKRAKEALRENEANLTVLVENTKDRIWAVDADYRLIVRNPQFLQGVREEQKCKIALGESVLLDSLPQAVQDEWRSYYDRALRGESFSVEKEMQFYKEPAFIDYRFHPIRSAEGKISGVVVSGRDITERKRAEEALKQANERLLLATIAGGVGIWDLDVVNNKLTWDDQMFRLYGVAPDNFGGAYETWKARVHPEDVERGDAEVQMALRGEKEFDTEFRVVWPSGTIHHIQARARVHRDAAGQPTKLIGTNYDITERKRAEEVLAQEQSLLHALMDNVPDQVYFKDVDSRFIRISKAQAERFCLNDPAQAVGKTDFDVFTEDHARPAFEDEQEIMKTGRPLVGLEEKETWPDGRTTWVSTTKVPLRDRQGRIIGTFGISRDITERKRAEEEIHRKAKELQEKNDELTRFTYAVSHDLKSPLVTIQTFQGHLEQDLRSQDAARVEKDLGYIRNAADKMGRLLDELLRFSRVGRSINPSEEAPLQAIVKEALNLVAGRITGRGVRVDLTEEPVVLYGDRTRLVEVFQNLVDNAAKFMGDQPAPRIEIGVEQAGEEAVLFVRDNGIGIDPQLQPLAFGLFHKLDPETEGEGIGLALVWRIVELHGGRIWVESEGLGKGTIFRFTLAKTRRDRGRGETP